MENQEKPVENDGETPQVETDPKRPEGSNSEGDGSGVKAGDSSGKSEKETQNKIESAPPTNVEEQANASTSGSTGNAPTSPAPVPDPSKTMRGVWFTSFGACKNVRVGDRNQPSAPSKSEVTVRVKISGINFIDLMIRMGYMDSANNNPAKPPFVLGTELIGEVVAVGPDVTRFKVKDTVFGMPEAGGAWAEYCNLDEKLAFLIPPTYSSIPLERLACTYNYLVAHLLLSKAGVSEGSNLLVHSAGGGVGFAVLQMAELIGAHVIGLVSEWKHEAVSKHRYTAVFKRNTDYVTEVRKLYPLGLDAVLDPVGGDDCGKGMSLLGPGGTYIMYGSVGSVSGESRGIFSIAKNWWTQGQFQVEKVSPAKLFQENTRIAGFNLKKLVQACPAKVEKALNFVWEVMASGEIDPVIDACVHYSDVAAQMAKMHDRKNIGKILVLPELPHPPVEEGTAAGEGDKGSSSGQKQAAAGDAAKETTTEGSGDKEENKEEEKKDAK